MLLNGYCKCLLWMCFDFDVVGFVGILLPYVKTIIPCDHLDFRCLILGGLAIHGTSLSNQQNDSENHLFLLFDSC